MRAYTRFAVSTACLFPLAIVGCEADGSNGGVELPDGAPGTGPLDTTLTRTPAALTNQTEATFEFTSTRLGRFGCRVDDQPPAECTSPFTTTVEEGPHTFEVAATTADGAVDTTPATFTWTVDTTPPKTSITEAPPAFDNSTNVTFGFTANEKATFRCSVDGGPLAPCTSPLSLSSLAAGQHTFSVAATDEAGNEEKPGVTHTWTIDTAPPDTTIDSGPTGSVNTSSNVFTFSSPVKGATFECAVDGGVFAACTSPNTVATSGDGLHELRVRARSVGGNVDPTPAKRTWTVDTVPPTVSIDGGPSGPTNDTTPTFTFTAEAGSTTTCHVDTDAFAACDTSFTTAALSAGDHTFEVEAKDAAGNVATASRSFAVDLTGPVITILTGPSAGGTTNVKTGSFTFSADETATTECRIGGAFAPCTSPFGYGPLTDDTYTFEVRGTDIAGNLGAVTSRTFTIDTIPPAVSITNPTVVSASAGDPVTFTFTAEAGSTTVCRVYADGNPSGAFAPCTSPKTITTPSQPGTWVFEVRATDTAGNSATTNVKFYTYILG